MTYSSVRVHPHHASYSNNKVHIESVGNQTDNYLRLGVDPAVITHYPLPIIDCNCVTLKYWTQ